MINIGIDGDDTLWHNESLFALTTAQLGEWLAPHIDDPVHAEQRLLATERRNLELFGYGIKGFTLSMIETAIEISDGRVEAATIQCIIERAKEMIQHPVELLPGVRETVETLRDRAARLFLVTKGDLLDQESKVARSGLAELFDAVEIVSEKDERTYRQVIERHGVEPSTFVMVGNSVRSDVLPVIGIGGRAVHIPYHLTWAHEVVAAHHVTPQSYWELQDITQVPHLLQREGLL